MSSADEPHFNVGFGVWIQGNEILNEEFFYVNKTLEDSSCFDQRINVLFVIKTISN